MILLVNPNNRNPAPVAAIEPPLWLALIAGYRRASGAEVQILDAEAEGLTVCSTVSRIEAAHADEVLIVVMGNNPSVSSTPKMAVAEQLLQHVDARVTGLHPSAVNHPRAVLVPFEGCPDPAWDLLDLNRYRAHNWHCLDALDKRSPYGVLYTSLNCPYGCGYCNVHSLYGDRKVRFRPLENVFADLRYFAEHGVRNVKIRDEMFTLRPDRIDIICEFIRAEGFDFNMWAYARLDSVTLRRLQRLRDAGIRWLAYGFEDVHDSKMARHLPTEEVIAWTREACINIIANFMFGIPGQTIDDMKVSLDFAMRHNFEWVNFSVALPYPGSDWYDSLKEKPTDWSSFGQFAANICAAPEVVAFRNRAFHDYIARPEYLAMIGRRFGPQAVEHIRSQVQAWYPPHPISPGPDGISPGPDGI